MAKARKYCLFCGEPDYIRAKEHVIPDWLLKHLRLRDYQINPVLHKIASGSGGGAIRFGSVRSEVVRRHPLSSFVNGGVCKDCNNGWMSELEGEAAPDLVGLIDGTAVLASLSDGSRSVLSRWAAKTAYALYFSFQQLEYVPLAHPRASRGLKGGCPPGVLAFAGQFGFKNPISFYCSSDWHGMGSDLALLAGLEQVREQSYKISFSLCNLHLMIAFLGSPGWRISPVSGFHFPLYAPADLVFWRDSSSDPMLQLPGFGLPAPFYMHDPMGLPLLFQRGLQAASPDWPPSNRRDFPQQSSPPEGP